MAPMRVIQGTAERRRQSAIEAAYDHFRVDRQGNLVSACTLDTTTTWSGRSSAGCARRTPRSSASRTWTCPSSATTRLDLATRPLRAHRPAVRAGHDPRRAPAAGHLPPLGGRRGVPGRSAHPQAQGAQGSPRRRRRSTTSSRCARSWRPAIPGCRRRSWSSASSSAAASGRLRSAAWQVEGPDGLSDLMLDSLTRGRVELRVRWDGGAKGRKSRRVPVTPGWLRPSSATRRGTGASRTSTRCSSTSAVAPTRGSASTR